MKSVKPMMPCDPHEPRENDRIMPRIAERFNASGRIHGAEFAAAIEDYTNGV
jgi:hypothetical protein